MSQVVQADGWHPGLAARWLTCEIVRDDCDTPPMTDDEASPTTSAEVAEVYEEAGLPVAAADGKSSPDHSVRYIRPSGQVVSPAVVPGDTLRGSPSWRRVR
jgi:hypothetical protein